MLTSANLTDPAVMHPPGAWEDLAIELEKRNQWSQAMRAWEKAMSASAGHNRRARYDERAKQAERKSHG